MDQAEYNKFQNSLLEYYQTQGRHSLPWRQAEPNGSFDAYKILVSEVMLQQTQVPRVLPKFLAFIDRFPTPQALATAPLKDVLIAWQGLGYNRRAKFLWQAAQVIVNQYGGVMPKDQAELQKLPGIGPNTAGAILVYAYNQPVVFIETNIRTVFIHHFFQDQQNIPDKEILKLIERTLPREGKEQPERRIHSGARRDEKAGVPGKCEAFFGAEYRRFVSYRVWYWMIMDYGTYLKQSVGNLTRASKSYAKQTTFQGSLRQLRGQVLRLLAAASTSHDMLLGELADPRAEKVLHDLEHEGLIRRTGNTYELP